MADVSTPPPPPGGGDEIFWSGRGGNVYHVESEYIRAIHFYVDNYKPM